MYAGVDRDTYNFKMYLAKQKLLISLATSYSHIVEQLAECPDEVAMMVLV
jgi:hypothetical protein